MKGQDFKIARIIKGMKVYEVANQLGVHRTYISKLENGVQAIPPHVYTKWLEILENK